MSIWHTEIVRVNGNLKAYIEIQNDYTGSTKGYLRELHLDGNEYFCRADGHRVPMTKEREKFLIYEARERCAMELYNEKRKGILK